jgi:hypothetical protein
MVVSGDHASLRTNGGSCRFASVPIGIWTVWQYASTGSAGVQGVCLETDSLVKGEKKDRSVEEERSA